MLTALKERAKESSSKYNGKYWSWKWKEIYEVGSSGADFTYKSGNLFGEVLRAPEL